MVSRYPYIDRNSCVIPAGKSFGDPCAKAKDCFNSVGFQEQVEVLQKQLGETEPKDYGPTRKGLDYSGVFTEVRHCLGGPLKSHFESIEDEFKNSVYNSYWNKPLGKTKDQTQGLPKGMDVNFTTFGKSTTSSVSAGEVVNPRKTPGQILFYDKMYHDLYKFSHQDYYAGERIQRSYAPPFNILNTFGAPSKVDHSGSRTKTVLTWFNNDPISNVSRRQAAVKERKSAPIGQSLDKTGVSDLFDVNHSFGKPIKRDPYGVEDLLNEYTPSITRRNMREFISYANKLRRKVHHLVNTGDLILEEIYDELLNLDEDKTCTLHFDCVDQICKRHFVYMNRSKIEPLLITLGILKPDGKIRYKDFLDILDLNKDFPSLKREHYIMPPEYQAYDKEASSELSAVNSKSQNASAEMSSNPKCKSVPYHPLSRVEVDNLGTEATARALISPSIYTQYGLSHRDFFTPRSKEFLSDLFRRIGCALSDEDVNVIYDEGAAMDKSRGVCIETFRNLLDVRAYKTYHRL